MLKPSVPVNPQFWPFYGIPWEINSFGLQVGHRNVDQTLPRKLGLQGLQMPASFQFPPCTKRPNNLCLGGFHLSPRFLRVVRFPGLRIWKCEIWIHHVMVAHYSSHWLPRVNLGKDCIAGDEKRNEWFVRLSFVAPHSFRFRPCLMHGPHEKYPVVHLLMTYDC